MSNVITIAGDYEDAGSMIDAIKTDPEVKKWVWAAALENAANN